MNRRQRIAAWVALAVICVLVHWRGLASWFHADDFAWLGLGLNHHTTHDLLRAVFSPMAQGTIRPWSDRLPFLASYGFFRLDALPIHILVFATQFVNLALVAWIGDRITGRRAAGFIAALLWTVSGTSADPLAWASAYNQVLCGFFLLLAFYFLLRYIETAETRFYVYQCVTFLLGFGALETNVVYPALAAAYTFFCARKYLRSVLPLFIPSIVYAAIHLAVAPAGNDPNYVLHFTGGMLRTLAKYWAWTVGPVDFWAPAGIPHALVVAAVVLVSLGLLAFAATRGRLAIFCLTWFVIMIAPVLPLRDHVMAYYPFLPAIGLCWLAGWALTEMWPSAAWKRAAACALAGLYVLIMLPRTLAASDYNYQISERVRNVVEGVQRAHELHPDKTILLDGVDTALYYNGVLDHPFRLIPVDPVYLTPGSEHHIESHPELGDLGEFLLPSDVLVKAIEDDKIAVYDVRGPQLRNITSDFASQPHDLGLPLRVEAANPLMANLLGPEWYPPDGNHRWMPQRASLHMAGPPSAGRKLYLHGYYPSDQMSAGPVSVTVTIDGAPLEPAAIHTGGDFELAFPLPGAVVGLPSMQVVVEVNRTFRAGADVRDLGLAFGVFEVK